MHVRFKWRTHGHSAMPKIKNGVVVSLGDENWPTICSHEALVTTARCLPPMYGVRVFANSNALLEHADSSLLNSVRQVSTQPRERDLAKRRSPKQLASWHSCWFNPYLDESRCELMDFVTHITSRGYDRLSSFRQHLRINRAEQLSNRQGKERESIPRAARGSDSNVQRIAIIRGATPLCTSVRPSKRGHSSIGWVRYRIVSCVAGCAKHGKGRIV